MMLATIHYGPAIAQAKRAMDHEADTLGKLAPDTLEADIQTDKLAEAEAHWNALRCRHQGRDVHADTYGVIAEMAHLRVQSKTGARL